MDNGCKRRCTSNTIFDSRNIPTNLPRKGYAYGTPYYIYYTFVL
nr:MAG TPA: hypothetical protein [Crassvirales sp.]